MASLFLRNLIFTILLPGTVAGWIPYTLIRDEWVSIIQSLESFQYLGVPVFLLGFIILLLCIIRFAVDGRGTLAPIDPTKKLVVTGLYRYSRNPMYVGVITMLIGEAIFTWAADLWIYTLVVFIAFNLFIRFIEEPRLKRDFGEEYRRYCQRVRRWV